mgnify:CR=1 FL=1
MKNRSGEAYRMPPGWFGGSLLVDFTSREASEWFLSKRKYLIEEIGIDGFKCDGAEFVWGRDVFSSDGTWGDELRNAYPDKYLKAYSEFTKKYNPEAILFNRAGGVQASQNSISWTGDQRSSFSAFKDALRACMNASMSGIPFFAWDAAGFNDDIPTAELYKRGVAQAAFSPIMQVHSESPGDPQPSRARTPWNMAERTGDEDCINVYRKFSNMRMNLLPYLYTEARYTSITGIPMMRSMVFEYPEFTEKAEDLFQYMLGGSLLVAPVVEKGVKEWKVFLPEGEWYDLFSGRKYKGNQIIKCDADVDAIPVFVKAGSIVLMNLNQQYQFGGKIGNGIDSFDNLVFRIYPAGKTNYSMYEYTSMKEIFVSVSENRDKSSIHVEISPFSTDCTLNAFTAKPKAVSIDDRNNREHKSLDKLASSDEGYYFDEVSGSVYIKVQRSMKERKVTIS